MFNPFSSSFEQLQLKLLTVVLRFLFLYRFQGSVPSRSLCSRASLYIIPLFKTNVNTFFEKKSSFFRKNLKPLIYKGLRHFLPQNRFETRFIGTPIYQIVLVNGR